jgi:hypothetical protein
MSVLPSPPSIYERAWANTFTRSVEQALQGLRQPTGIGYTVRSAAPYRTFDSRVGTSAEAQVGDVVVSIDGEVSVIVTPDGVGGAYDPPPLEDVARVLGTYLADARARGLLG